MQYRKVVDLTACRDLLAKWLQVRDRITQANAQGFILCIRNEDGSETIEIVGNYERNPADALKASMHMSWELTRRSGISPP